MTRQYRDYVDSDLSVTIQDQHAFWSDAEDLLDATLFGRVDPSRDGRELRREAPAGARRKAD
ncbi:MAG: hypothetical protein ACK4WC_06575 [Rubrimonas sp.]